MDPKAVERFVSHLSGGLEFLLKGKCVDIAVVDQQRGSTEPCDWLEFSRIPFGKDDGHIAACWLFEGKRVAVGLHLPSDKVEVATPSGWTYEGSLSERFSFVRNEAVQGRLNAYELMTE